MFTRSFCELMGAFGQRPMTFLVPSTSMILLAKMAYCPFTTLGMLMFATELQVAPLRVLLTVTSSSVVVSSG